MNLLEHYQRTVASGEILEDSQQRSAIQKLQTICESLVAEKGFLSHFSNTTPKGLYLWGSVGIGKTFLMDTFYHFLPFENKWRTHFLPFMHEVHAALYALQGIKNPLKEIAKRWSQKTRVICFDELVVNDVADALVLGGLLDAFFAHKICMIFTSNVAPDDLYKNGIQRDLFLPTIEKIKNYNEVVHLSVVDDYRTRYPGHAKHYWSPLTTTAQENMQQAFVLFSQGTTASTTPLVIYEREIPIKKAAGNVIWFDFLDICGVPRSQDDYLVIAQKFHTILISNLTPIRASENDLARSFIQLIDILYDAKVRLIISAALPIDQIYTEGKLLFEFNRTRSRLIQMQSESWEKEHSLASSNFSKSQNTTPLATD
jgi:cell division protein ZapE